jgi:hypothetical protein
MAFSAPVFAVYICVQEEPVIDPENAAEHINIISEEAKIAICNFIT